MKENYTLIRSNRKTASLQIAKDGELIVRAGHRVSTSEIEKMITQYEGWIQSAREKVLRRQLIMDHLDDDDLIDLRRQAKNILPAKAAAFSRKMGVTYGKISITSAQGRFGSCSSKGNLCFSLYLMLYPEDAIDYVVVHELAHLLELNHSPRFHAIVESILPDWRRRKDLLRPEYMKPYL